MCRKLSSHTDLQRSPGRMNMCKWQVTETSHLPLNECRKPAQDFLQLLNPRHISTAHSNLCIYLDCPLVTCVTFLLPSHIISENMALYRASTSYSRFGETCLMASRYAAALWREQVLEGGRCSSVSLLWLYSCHVLSVGLFVIRPFIFMHLRAMFYWTTWMPSCCYWFSLC